MGGWRKKSRYKRDKYTLPSRVEVGDAELFWHNPYEFIEGPDETFIEKIVEWLQNFKVNFETIGFDRTVEDLPRIKGSALVIDHPFTGTLDRHLEGLREYDGTVLVTDRALRKVLPYKIPDIVANIDSSYLCWYFFDVPEVKKHMKEINAVFAATTHPLTIRAWTSRTRYFFMPWLGSSYLTYNLAAMGGLQVLYTGGEVSTLIWLLAVNLGAKHIGMLAIDNCFHSIQETEYPGVPHEIWEVNPWSGKKLPRTAYVDPVYKHYAEVHHALIKYAKEKYGIETYNCSPESGIMHAPWITDMPLKEFVRKFR